MRLPARLKTEEMSEGMFCERLTLRASGERGREPIEVGVS